MKKKSIILLKIIVIIIGIGTFSFMLWEPHLEGRNLHATVFEIYFNDPFLAYIYLASISFFVGLYQVFKLLNYINQNSIFSLKSVRTLQIIKYCAIILIFFILGAEAYFFIFQSRKGEDIAGGVAIGLFMIIISFIVACIAILFEKKLQNAVELKFENNLTM